MARREKRDAESTIGAHLTGDVVDRPLDDVRPNDWNPNELEPHKVETIRRGFQTVGWLRSDSLLVWGTDEKGERRDLIINGEHRWKIARELGMKVGPMVALDGLTRAEAAELTVMLDQGRGRWNPEKLGPLLKYIEEQRKLADRFESVDDLATELGFRGSELLEQLGPRAPNGSGITNARGEWAGMPEFDQRDRTAFRQIVVNFTCEDDVKRFAAAIGRDLTERTRSIWFPEVEIERLMDKRYAEDA